MESTARTFTPEQWARHEKVVEMIRAAKQRKEAWVKKMQAQWAQEDLMRNVRTLHPRYMLHGHTNDVYHH